MANIPLWQQAGLLRSYFPASQIKWKGDQELSWTGILRPSALGGFYKVKIFYSQSRGLSVYVVEPNLVLAKGCTSLPHVYNSERQKLCLFFPKKREWNRKMWMAKTILTWASEWLYFYEIWVVTDGQWLGGGIAHEQVELNNTENKINAPNGTE